MLLVKIVIAVFITIAIGAMNSIDYEEQVKLEAKYCNDVSNLVHPDYLRAYSSVCIRR